MKAILSIKNNNEFNSNNNDNTKVNNQNIKNNNNDNMLFKSIKDMEFANNDSFKKDEKYEKDNDYFERVMKIIKSDEIDEKKNKEDKDRESKRVKSENIKKRREEFNRLNINDLDSLYFNYKINNIDCYNSKKNYDKVPKIRFLSNCKY